MAAERVTIFGASGFLGRYMVRRLAADGATIIAAQRHPEEARFLKMAGDPGQIVPIAASLADAASVSRAVAGASVVINLVGILDESGGRRFNAVHRDGARRIAEAAAAGARRLIQVSALGASAQSPSAYARSKAGGERAVLDAFPSATILRPGVVFGAEDNFLNRFAAMARLSPALPLIGGGHNRMQPVFVGDVAAAAAAVLADPRTAGRTYELGGPGVYSMRRLMELVLSYSGRRRLLVWVPTPLASVLAAVLGLLPQPPLTRDQVRQLQYDNVVADGALSLADLGVTATPLETVAPQTLARFRRAGGLAGAADRARPA
ncbi:MAG: complex I NDUFA9 subunit family protein [Alphaproteobacteria bacterium]